MMCPSIKPAMAKIADSFFVVNNNDEMNVFTNLHFLIENKQLLENHILPFSNIIDIYAMCDDSAILICNERRRFFGNVYLASKGKIEKHVESIE